MGHSTTKIRLRKGKGPAPQSQPEDGAKISTRLKCGIVLSEQGICPALSRNEMQFVKARYAESLDKLPEAKAIQYIVEMLNRSYAELGHVPVGSSIQERANLMKATAGLILNDLLFHYPKVTLEEIGNAVRRGIRREYGEYYGFNAISIHEFVKKYLNSDDRLNALDRQSRYLNTQKPVEEISEQEKERLLREGLEQCRETYRKTGRIIDFGNVNYQLLVDSGDINLSIEEKLEIYREARIQIKTELDAQAVSFHQIVSRMRGEESDEAAVVARAKEISLSRYFDGS